MTQWERTKLDPIKHELKKQKMREHYRAKLRPAHMVGLPVKRGKPPLDPVERERRRLARVAQIQVIRSAAAAKRLAGLALWYQCQIIHCKMCKLPFMRSELPASSRRCGPCRKLHRKAYRTRHPHVAKVQRQRRRALERKADGSLSEADWLHVLKGHNHACARCSSTENLTMDHKIPLSLGGSHDWTNLQPLCHLCNSAKRNVMTGAVQACIPGVRLTHA